jgi:hypothetical protein
MSENLPPWLKAMQNGSIGEARTRAFLIDRFWVLERSVDIDGADFIIQRRITSANLLDKSPPRFGIVQAKFFASSETAHYIRKEYLVDKDGEIRKEFFMVCHSGTEENAKSYLLSAEDLMNDFELTTDGRIKLPGKMLLRSSKYEIILKTLSLDRMERALNLADFSKNRRFLSWFLPSARLDPNDIDSIYQEPIDNWWGDIPQGFLTLKKAAQKVASDIEDLHKDLVAIVEASDPERALSILEDIRYSYGTIGGGLPTFLSLDHLYDDNFREAVLQHKNKVTVLKEAGLLDAFIKLKVDLQSRLAKDLASRMPIDSDMIYRLEVKYDSLNFSDLVIIGDLQPATVFSERNREYNDIPWFERISKGLIVICWRPGLFIPDRQILDEIYEVQYGLPKLTEQRADQGGTSWQAK